MEFKLLVYLIGGIVYFVYKQYQKLQKEALNRKQELQPLEKQVPEPILVEAAKPTPRVKAERQQIERENSIKRLQNKMVKQKASKPFFEKPEHVISVFESNSSNSGIFNTAILDDEKGTIGNGKAWFDEIEYKKIVLYNVLLNRPTW